MAMASNITKICSMQLPLSIIRQLEDKRTSIYSFIITFVAMVILRHLLESFSQQSNYLLDSGPIYWLNFFHNLLFFSNLALFSLIYIQLAIGISVELAARVLLPGMIIILMPPLIDLIYSAGRGLDMRYIMPGKVANLADAYLRVGGGYTGITVGMRCEIVLGFALFYLYLRLKKANILTSLFYTWANYTTLFIAGSSPLFLALLYPNLQEKINSFNFLMVHFYLLSASVAGVIIFLLNNPRAILSQVSISYWLGWLQGVVLLVGGILLNIKQSPLPMLAYFQQASVSYTSPLLAILSLFWLSLSLAACAKQKAASAITFILLAVICALFLTLKTLFFIMVIFAVLYLYLQPPLVARRLFLLGPCFLALAAFAGLLAGYFCVGNSNIAMLPKRIASLVLSGYLGIGIMYQLKASMAPYYFSKQAANRASARLR
jgi:hypothetical protein